MLKNNSLNTLAVILTGAALMVGLWLVMKPRPATVVETPELHDFRYELREGVVSGPESLQVQQGDQVRIELHSDAADDLHLHGYDLNGKVAPGSPLVLSFQAERSGRFELELHDAHQSIGILEVYPRP